MKRTRKQIGSLLLSVCMVFTMLPTAAFAEEGVQDSGTAPGTSEITAFADLAEDVALQEVETGTTVDELNLPSALTVTVTTGSAMTATVSGESDVATDSDAQETETQEETTVEVSNWVADPDYDSDTAGDYTFTPTLDIPEGISVAAGVTPPQITVTVEETAAPMLRGAEMQLLGTRADTDITANFTDTNFLAAVYAKIGKTAPEAIYDTDVSGITFLEVIDKSISSLAGIEHFAALTHLNCNNNLLTELNVSSNTALINLACNDNQLASLDVSNHTALTNLTCYNNQLTSLNVSGDTALTDLTCNNNLLTGLNVSSNTALIHLYCSRNQLTVLDVSHNTELTHLYFNTNRLTSLNVSGNTTLTKLDCGSNRLTSLDLTQNTILTYFSGINQEVSLTMAGSGGSYSAGVSMPTGTTFGNTALSYADGTLTSTSNTATSSTFTAQTGLSDKTLSGTLTLTYPAASAPTYNTGDIAVINSIITNNGLAWTTAPTDGSSVPTNWTKATWSNDTTNKRINQLSLPSKNLSGALDVSGLTALQSLLCDDNQLTSLNASGPVNLTTLSCASNQLTSLNVSGLTSLTFLDCASNQLTSLNVSGPTALRTLRCASNRLTSLDLTQNSYLTSFSGTDQAVPLTMAGSGSSYSVGVSMPAGTTFGNTALSYAGGTLTSTSNIVLAPTFTAPTGLSEKNLTGTLTLTYEGVTPPAPTYNAGDIAVINSIIANNNSLGWTTADPANGSDTTNDWEGVTWSGDTTNNRITQLNLFNKNLSGALDVSGLTDLISLVCSSNQITSLNVSGLTGLIGLDCHSNRLTSLDVSGLTDLNGLDCSSNQITSLDLTQNTSLSNFSGINQAVSLTMAGSGGSYLAVVSMPAGTTFGNIALSYAGGTLTSTSNTVLAPTFTAPTGLSEKNLTGTLTLTYEDIPAGALAITQHPQNVSAKIGEDATFRIVAENATSYQWYCSASINDIPQGGNGKIVDTVGRVSGATTATLTLYNVTEKMNGETIYCMVTGANSSDVVRSNLANLAVTSVTPTKYAITVNSGTASQSSAAEGATVTITASTPENEKRFKGWTVVSGGVALANAQAVTTIFTMPANAVEITATYEDIPAGVTSVTGVTLNKNSLSLYSNTTPNTATLIATVAPASATDKSVTWQSSNTTVATVDASGNLRALRKGTATITVSTTDGGHTASCTVRVLTYSSGGGSSSGGSSGGDSSSSGSSSTTTTTTTEKKPNQPVTAAAPITATAGTNGAASASIPDKAISDAITKAQADAKAQGKTTNGVSVALNVTMPKEATALTATLSRNALNSLVSAGVTSLKIKGSPVTVAFDQKALTEIQKKSSGNINITIAPKINLSETAKKMIGTRPVYNITVNYDNSSTVSSFGGGVATVAIPYAPANGEAIGGVYALYVDEKGNATRIAGSAYDANSGCVIFTTPHFSMYGIGYTAPSAKFTDINSHWAKESIDYVVGRGLLSGTTETTFAPDTAMTRGMLVTALGRLAGVDTKAYTTSSFTDVNGDSAYRPYIEWAYKKGIIKGIGSNQFAPDRAITREEIAVIIANFAKAIGYTLPVTREATTYSDASSIGSTYKTAVTAMQQAGIMMGGTSNKFNPKLNATRAEVSSMLGRYIKLTIDPDTVQGWTLNDAGQYLYYKDSKVHTGTQTIDGVKYFFNSNGILQTGWVKDGANWRYYSGNNALVGWHDIGANGNSETYYFNKDGIMTSRKWLEIDGKWYYFYMDGSLIKSTKIDDYEVDENGVRKTK